VHLQMRGRGWRRGRAGGGEGGNPVPPSRSGSSTLRCGLISSPEGACNGQLPAVHGVVSVCASALPELHFRFLASVRSYLRASQGGSDFGKRSSYARDAIYERPGTTLWGDVEMATPSKQRHGRSAMQKLYRSALACGWRRGHRSTDLRQKRASSRVVRPGAPLPAYQHLRFAGHYP
jgi:hypothetical protein